MRRLVLVTATAAAIIAVWWLAEDSDLRHELTAAGEAVLQKARGGSPPSWGDVAERVGEFAKEEQGLKQTVGRLDAESAGMAAPPAGPAAAE